ncbi:MAG: hypothetical protein JRJ84_17940, partial [Deltaproteobacteria bacterium]|nr:hypothetical protein [Deltaproteobacteria bacterium]
MTLRCEGCGEVVAASAEAPFPFRCPKAGRDGADHLLAPVFDPAWTHFPEDPIEGNPFLDYRGLLHSHALACAHGLGDEGFVALVERLDAAVAAVDWTGFRATPFGPLPALGASLGFQDGGAVWVKDDTANVGGSHKARHLMGILLHL